MEVQSVDARAAETADKQDDAKTAIIERSNVAVMCDRILKAVVFSVLVLSPVVSTF